jgi:ribose transport system ATP-binding protein
MLALQHVDVEVRAGEIHALVGGNGSGKSTLIKVVCGVYRGEPGGYIQIGETKIAADAITPEAARAAGVAVVHQDLGVFGELSVAENMALGHGYDTVLGRVRWSRLRKRTWQLIERFQIDATPNTQVRTLSQAARTQVAIARALQSEDEGSEGLLILDEPTSSLPAREVALLLAVLRRYADAGEAILYVSHRLDEVLSTADRITVLRDGVKVGTYLAADLDEDKLIELILGRSIDRAFPAMPAVTDADPVLEVQNLCAGPLQDVSLRVAEGQVLGIAGLLGSGRTELLRALFGDLRTASGTMSIGGHPYAPRRPLDAIHAGVAYVPENRFADGVFHDLTVATNMSMANLSDYWQRGHMASRDMRRDSRELMGQFHIKAASEQVPIATLSGGNQQKAIIARWLRRKPRLLLLDEPTQGVDVGARSEIYGLIRSAVAEGAAAVVVASDFEELANVCDRALILEDGRTGAEVVPPHLTPERLTQMVYRRHQPGRES